MSLLLTTFPECLRMWSLLPETYILLWCRRSCCRYSAGRSLLAEDFPAPPCTSTPSPPCSSRDHLFILQRCDMRSIQGKAFTLWSVPSQYRPTFICLIWFLQARRVETKRFAGCVLGPPGSLKMPNGLGVLAFKPSRKHSKGLFYRQTFSL